MFKKVLLQALISFIGIQAIPFKPLEGSLADATGCVKCHPVDDTKINVHLIPHSHDDVGWLKTVDQYYYGMRTDIQHAGVQYIITSVVEALWENENRRYIQVETAFFWKWWKAQSDNMRQKFKSLVDNGQIEMVNGAWSMNDEACAHYQSTIDQFTWGLRTINETVGICGVPRIGWQIDPFGHSREQASLFAQLGYDGVFFARLDHADRSNRMKTSTMDFAWQGSANLDNSIIFGGIFPTSLYFPPNGFCWDYGCSDDPVDDNPESSDYNVEVLVETFQKIIKEYIKYYPTNNVIIPMGGDFQYEAAEMNYINMDRLINAFRGHEGINLIYSTPSCYIQAVNFAQPTLKLKTDDFFPYSDQLHSYWTGYFTSRPNSKRFERIGHGILQATKQLVALGSFFNETVYENNIKSLQYLREIMGIMQHHDAITGTEKQHVANDYVRQLTRGVEYAEKPIGQVVGELLTINSTGNINLELSSCLLSNISICNITTQSDRFVVVVYNPLAWPVTHYVRLPVDSRSFNIQGPDGREIYDIVNPISYFATAISSLQSPSDLVFAAKNVAPMGIKLYYISKEASVSDDLNQPIVKDDDELVFGDNNTNFKIDTSTKLLKSVTMNGITVDITQNFYYYYSGTGGDDGINISSGAYLFRPNDLASEYLVRGVSEVGSMKGTLVDEYHQKWRDSKVNVSQIIRVYKNEGYIEFDWLVGGIDIDDNMGKEVITRYSVANYNNDNTFYTDSNGREMIERKINSRQDYTYNSSADPITSNYYPIPSKIVIKDRIRNVEIAVLTDRSQGGSSLVNGQIELMVHRRIVHDDNKGVAENLNETEYDSGVYVRGSHYLVIGSASNTNPNGKTTAAQERILAQKKLVQPWVGISNINSFTYDDIHSKFSFVYSALTDALPENINILTFEPWTDGTYLLRFEHILEKDEDPVLSNITTIDISNLFSKFTIKEITETTLGANEWLGDYQAREKYYWNVTGDKMDVVSNVNDTSETLLTLTPMQIRTFVVKLDDVNFGISLKPISPIILMCVLGFFLLN